MSKVLFVHFINTTACILPWHVRILRTYITRHVRILGGGLRQNLINITKK